MTSPDAARRLHPNLARIAAVYDDVVAGFARGELSPDEARHRISSLVARDDQGITWCISPNDGQWYRVTVTGELVADTPPEAGVATYTGWDLSGDGRLDDPRLRIVDHRVDPRTLGDADDLGGSTARYVRNAAEPEPRRKWFPIAIAVLVAVVVLSAFLALRGGGDDGAPAPVSVPTSVPGTVPGP